MLKAPRNLTFKCAKCAKAVQVSLQKVSACSHITPYSGVCSCGEVKLHAIGQPDAVKAYLASNGLWTHHH
jgi:hypothetical protein